MNITSTTIRNRTRGSRLRGALVAAGMAAGLLAVGGASPVEASTGNCPTTKFCTWDSSGYPGSPHDTYNAPSSGNASIHYKSRFNGTYSYKTLISTQANGAGTTTCIKPRHGYSFGSTQYHNYRLITAGTTCLG